MIQLKTLFDFVSVGRKTLSCMMVGTELTRLPFCPPDSICLAARVTIQGQYLYFVVIPVGNEEYQTTSVQCYYPGHGELLVTLTIHREIFSPLSNLPVFKEVMGIYEVIDYAATCDMEADTIRARSPITVCYRLDLPDSQMTEVINIGEFNYHDEVEYVRPSFFFMEFVVAGLKALGLSFAQTLYGPYEA